jgi:hypothetical protein
VASEGPHSTILSLTRSIFTAISERLDEAGAFALIQPIYELMVGSMK